MLIDIDDDDSNNTEETIFFNNNAHISDFSPNLVGYREAHLVQGEGDGEDDEDDPVDELERQTELWGDAYPFKPVAQDKWDDKVRAAAVAATSVDVDIRPNMTADLRPRAYDYNSGQWCLLDSGAAVSCFPRSHFPQRPVNSSQILQAVNGAQISTYGNENVKINLGGKTYEQEFVLSDVSEVILGWNFLVKFKLDLVWQGAKCMLVDKKNKFPLSLRKARRQNVGLALVTYKKYADAQKGKQSSDEKKPVPPQYQLLIDKHADVLKVNFHEIPRHNIIHTIETGNNKPCKAKLRPLQMGSPKERDGYKAWKELEELGVVERIGPGETTQWSSALHLVTKADGTQRPCGDYRGLNDHTLLDVYPLPQLKQFTPKLQGAKVFSTIDLFKSYHQIPLDGPSSNKTCLLTPWGNFKFKRLAMGLRNSAQSFQKMLDYILRDMSNVVCYLDDILVYTENEERHLEVVDDLLSRLEAAGLTINLGKCNFAQPQLTYLGYTINSQGIKPVMKKLQAISNFPPPSRPKELLGFLGAANYYRRCLQKYKGKNPAEWMKPLYSAATNKRPGQKFVDTWRELKLQENFDAVKAMIMNAAKLAHPDPSAPLALTVDASKFAVGGTIEQFVNNCWQPLGFWSRKLKENQVKWTCFRRELYAIQQGLRYFLDEVKGRHIVIFSDHKPIIGAFRNRQAMPYDPIAYNQLVEVSMFTNDVRYLQAKSNAVADTLSRPPHVPIGAAYDVPAEGPLVDGQDVIAAVTPQVDAVALQIVDHKQMQADQQSCPDVAAHRAGKHVQSLKMKEVEFSPGCHLLCDLSNGKKARPLVPKPHRELIIRWFHNVSHPGSKETLKKIADRYYWPTVRQDVAKYVAECHPCNACKAKPIIKPPMDPRPVMAPRFKDLQIDVVGPMEQSEGMRYLLTVLDRTSRYYDAIPMASATASACASGFIRHWVAHFGLPFKATSDSGNVFISKLWKELHKELGSIVAYSPLYSPSSLGSVERIHKDIKASLKATLLAMGDEHKSKWMSVLPWTLLSRRTSYHSELQATPSEVVFGENPAVPGDLAGADLPADPNLPALLDRVRANAQRPPAQTTIRRTPQVYYPPSTDTATHVYLRNQKPTPLSPMRDGPYQIIERLGKSTVKVKTGEFKSGAPRTEVHHWRNCTPYILPQNADSAVKKPLGRPRKALD